MLSPHLFEVGQGVCLFFYPFVAICCAITMLNRIRLKQRDPDNSLKKTRTFTPAIVGSYALAMFLLILWIYKFSTTGLGFNLSNPILANERTALLIFNATGITLTLLFYAALIQGLKTKQLRTRFTGWITILTFVTIPPFYTAVQRSGLTNFKLVDTQTILQNLPEAESYQILYLNDDRVWNQSLNDPSTLKLKLEWAIDPEWGRIIFSNSGVQNESATVCTTSLIDYKKIIELPLKIEANQISLFRTQDPESKFQGQNTMWYVASIRTILKSEYNFGYGSKLAYENTDGSTQSFRTYNAACTTLRPRRKGAILSRMQMGHCTRLDEHHFLFSLGAREIYLINVKTKQAAKIADGYSPLVYTN